MTASSRNYPFEHPATHADWLPELDPLLVADQAPDSYAHTVAASRAYGGEVRELPDPQWTESDDRELTPEQQARILQEALGLHRAYSITEQIGSGASAADILDAEQARLRKKAGIEDPMGPDLDTPQF